MKLRKLACLGFNSSEFEDIYSYELDTLAEKGQLVANESGLATDLEGLLVKLGTKVNEVLIHKCQT